MRDASAGCHIEAVDAPRPSAVLWRRGARVAVGQIPPGRCPESGADVKCA